MCAFTISEYGARKDSPDCKIYSFYLQKQKKKTKLMFPLWYSKLIQFTLNKRTYWRSLIFTLNERVWIMLDCVCNVRMSSFFIPPAVIAFSLSSYFLSCSCGNLKVFCQLRFDLTASSLSHNNLVPPGLVPYKATISIRRSDWEFLFLPRHATFNFETSLK